MANIGDKIILQKLRKSRQFNGQLATIVKVRDDGLFSVDLDNKFSAVEEWEMEFGAGSKTPGWYGDSEREKRTISMIVSAKQFKLIK